MNAADGGAGVLIGGRGHGAGVENDDLGFVGGPGAQQSALEQSPLNGGAVCLGRSAAEVLHVIGRHKLIIPSAMMRLRFYVAHSMGVGSPYRIEGCRNETKQQP